MSCVRTSQIREAGVSTAFLAGLFRDVFTHAMLNLCATAVHIEVGGFSAVRVRIPRSMNLSTLSIARGFCNGAADTDDRDRESEQGRSGTNSTMPV